MKNIWLVYEKANVERNRFFIDQWHQASRNRNALIRLVLYEDLEFGLREGKPYIEHTEHLPLPDAAVMRLNQPLLTEQFELLGVKTFNNSKVARICNDKRLTHQFISRFAPSMDTVFLRGDESTSPLPYPVVMKGVHGCGGRQIFLARDQQGFSEARCKLPPGEILVQALSDTTGRDVRVYVLGKEVIAVMLRKSDQDFRSNIGQGGGAEPYILDSRTASIVDQIVHQFDFGLVGIDFIPHQGRLMFNEIEDAVGTRMLFANGHEDIVSRYLDFILHTFDK